MIIPGGGGNRTCSFYEYECPEGKCIPVSKVCDGHRDCNYGVDEEFCGDMTSKYMQKITRWEHVAKWIGCWTQDQKFWS